MAISRKTLTDYAWAIASVIVILLLSYIAYKNTHIQEKDNIISAMNDTLRISRDKEGKSYAEIQTLRTARAQDFLDIKFKDAEITKLQVSVEKYKKQIKNGGSVTNFSTTTTVASEGETIVTPGDTIIVDNIIQVYPIYTYKYDLKGPDEKIWITGSTISDRFKTTVQSKVFNEYEVVIGEESQGWFKEPKPFALVTNANPFSDTTQMRTYQVTPAPHKPWAISAVGAYGIGLLDFKAQPFVGAGVTWTPKFLRF